MGTLKDSYEAGRELLQFWFRFKGRRVRVWPRNMEERICIETRGLFLQAQAKAHVMGQDLGSVDSVVDSWQTDPVTKLAIKSIVEPDVEIIGAVKTAQLFEATLADVVKYPPGLYFVDVEYWVPTDDGKAVKKVRSTDEGLFLPLTELSRMDFVRQKERLEHLKKLCATSKIERAPNKPDAGDP